MRHSNALVFAVLIAASMPLFADDAPSDNPHKPYKDRMHECMAQQKAANPDVGWKERHKTCEAQLKTENNHLSRPPPTEK